MRARVASQYALMIAVLGALALTLVYPIWLTVKGGFVDDVVTGTGFTFRHIIGVFEDPVQVEGLINALLIAIVTTLLCLLISLPLAVLAANYKYPFKGVWNAVILVPLILPPFVGAIGMRALLGRSGALNALFGTDWDILGTGKFWGVVIVEALHLYPILYLNATASLANLDPALDEAAENLGISPLKRFFCITLPLIRPGLFAGGTIVFIWSFTELGTPLIFDMYNVTPVQIFNGIKEVDTSASPYALTVVMLAVAILCYTLGKLVFGGKGYQMTTRASRAGGETQLPLVPGLLAMGAFGIVTVLALLPHVGVVLEAMTAEGSWYNSVLPGKITGEHFESALTHPMAFGSIVNSLQFSAAAVAVDIVLGLLIAYLIVRTTIRGRFLLDSLSMLPLAVPGLVMAFGYVAVTLSWPFGPGDPLHGVVGVIGADPNPIPLLIMAYAVRRLPYVVRSAVAGLETTSGELEEAAVNLGASTITAVRKIIVPLIMANLIAGGLLAFSFAMLEVSDSLILAQQEKHYPITKAIYTFTARLGDGSGIASAMGVWGMALLTVTLVGASIMLGKKLGAIFRV